MEGSEERVNGYGADLEMGRLGYNTGQTAVAAQVVAMRTCLTRDGRRVGSTNSCTVPCKGSVVKASAFRMPGGGAN